MKTTTFMAARCATAILVVASTTGLLYISACDVTGRNPFCAWAGIVASEIGLLLAAVIVVSLGIARWRRTKCILWAAAIVAYGLTWFLANEKIEEYRDGNRCKTTMDSIKELASRIESLRTALGSLPQTQADLKDLVGSWPESAWGTEIHYLVDRMPSNEYELVAMSSLLMPWVFEYSSTNKGVLKRTTPSFDEY